MDMEEEKDLKNNNIEIVTGHSKDLNISDVKDNLTFEVHKNETKKNGEIVIPSSQNKESEEDN